MNATTKVHRNLNLRKDHIVKDYFIKHPNALIRDCVRDTGLSTTTICKWLKVFRESEERSKPKS